MEFRLNNLTCGGCARSVTKAIQAIDPHADVATDPPTRIARVRTSLSEDEIVSALRSAGYPPRESL